MHIGLAKYQRGYDVDSVGLAPTSSCWKQDILTGYNYEPLKMDGYELKL